MVVSEGGLSHVRIPIGDHILTPMAESDSGVV